MSSTDALAHQLVAELDDRLRAADAALAAGFPGERPGRQPVHTVYVPAHRYHAGVVPAWGEAALAAMDTHDVAAVVADPDLVRRVRAKLAAEPVEDLRIDFEDGYGNPGDAIEDDAVRAAATALARAQADHTGAPFTGIRCKSFEAPTRARGVRTLTHFLATLLDLGGSLEGFVVTLPKVTSVDQVSAMVHACGRLESALGLAATTLRFEIQVETPQSVLGPDGTALVARMIHASERRCVGLHYGTYDYSASCGIAAPYQSLEHPVADHAKAVMQAAAAGTGVRLCDGSTNLLPVGDDTVAHWRLHQRLVRRSLERGFYQGWDLHPAQLPTRFAATFGFFRDGFDQAAERLRRYAAAVEGSVADEPASARALADFVLRGLDCGALGADEVTAASGLDPAALARLAPRGPS